MFRTLKIINTLQVTYGLVFAEILSDNGAEFASRNNPEEHPFEAMLLELGINTPLHKALSPADHWQDRTLLADPSTRTSSTAQPSITSITSPMSCLSTLSITITLDLTKHSTVRPQKTSP